MRRLMVGLAIVSLLAACTSGDASETTSSTSAIPVSTTATTSAPSSSTTMVTTTTFGATTSIPPPVEDSSMVVLVAAPQTGGPISAVADVDGHPVIAYVSDDGSLRLLYCSDEDCAGPIDEAVLGHPGESQTVELAMAPDGSPVVVVWPWDHEGRSLVYVCSDPMCETVESAELGDSEPCMFPDGRPCDWSVNYPSIAIPSDGLPRVVYTTQSDPPTIKLATCQTSTCSTWDWTTIDTLPPLAWTGAPSLRLDASDRLLVGYWYSMSYEIQQSRIAVCEDPSCAAAPTILTFDGVVFPQTTPGTTQDEFHVWYQTGSESLPSDLITDAALAAGASAFPAIWSDYSDFMITTCDARGCEEPQYVEVGEDWLLPQVRLFVAADGSAGGLFNHASRGEPNPQLHMTTCIDSRCTQGFTEALGVDTIYGDQLDVIITETTPRVVFVTEDGAIHFYTP